MLYVFAEEGDEYFVAETLEEAAELCRKHWTEECGIPVEEQEEPYLQRLDPETIQAVADYGPNGETVTKTWAEWAAENGKGFLFANFN